MLASMEAMQAELMKMMQHQTTIGDQSVNASDHATGSGTSKSIGDTVTSKSSMDHRNGQFVPDVFIAGDANGSNDDEENDNPEMMMLEDLANKSRV